MLPSIGWSPRDLGFPHWAVIPNRCRKLLVNEEGTFMGVVVISLDSLANGKANYKCPSLDSDDLLYLKEQMEAEEDAERLLRRTEKRAFAAFRKAASLADSSPASLPLPLRVEPKPKSGIRQQDLLRKIVEIRPKQQRVSGLSDRAGRNNASPSLCAQVSSAGNTDQSSGKNVSSSRQDDSKTNPDQQSSDKSSLKLEGAAKEAGTQNVVRSLLGLAYESSDED